MTHLSFAGQHHIHNSHIHKQISCEICDVLLRRPTDSIQICTCVRSSFYIQPQRMDLPAL